MTGGPGGAARWSWATRAERGGVGARWQAGPGECGVRGGRASVGLVTRSAARSRPGRGTGWRAGRSGRCGPGGAAQEKKRWRERGLRRWRAGWAAREGRAGRTGPRGKGWAGAGLTLVVGLFSIFFLLSFPNYTQTKLNSNSNLNSTLALNQIKEMLQHDATTKIKPMIKF